MLSKICPVWERGGGFGDKGVFAKYVDDTLVIFLWFFYDRGLPLCASEVQNGPQQSSPSQGQCSGVRSNDW